MIIFPHKYIQLYLYLNIQTQCVSFVKLTES